MSEKKSGFLPKFEVIIIGIFFLSFATWAISRCSATKKKYKEEIAMDAMEELGVDVQPIQRDTTPKVVIEKVQERFTPLYATIDGVNIRSEPKLKSKVIKRLKLFDEVSFLYEVTDFKEEIKLGDSIAVAPWIKVKTNEGKEGWIYGACVHYYKTRFDDVN